jgi:hypothetical protein
MFNLTYLLLTVFLLIIEICIAVFVKDTIIRPLVGDVLVVILLYCFFRTFLNIAVWKVALGVFLFACVIEVLQYFDYVALLGLENNRILSVIMGRTFEMLDFAAYFAGFWLIILIEKIVDLISKKPVYE